MFPLKDSIRPRRFPVLTVAIIALNAFMYFFVQDGLWSLPDDPTHTIEYGAIPFEITHPGDQCNGFTCGPDVGQDFPPTWLTLFASMFMHGSLLHLAGNMLFLWVFGNNIEDSMSPWRFIVFYLAGGMVALLGQTVADPNSAVPTIGASGAVAAVLGGYALLYPRARVITLIFIIIFFTIVELPALLVLGVWFLLQVMYGASELSQPVSGGGGVAYFAHIGGFVFGLILVRLFANRVHEDYDRPQRLPVY